MSAHHDGVENVAVRPSRIHGLGVFALRDFAPGELIFVRGYARDVTPEAPLREELGEYEHHCDWLEGGRQIYLPSPDRHVNHSCVANCDLAWIDGLAHNVALRPIAAGDEITHCYSVDLWDGDAWDCNCGSPRCLGRVPGSFYALPLERQIQLMPQLDDWFIKDHPAAYEALRRAAGLST